MPGTYGDAVTENIASGLGFKGVRGTGSLSSTWVRGGADATLAKGYDVFNILSQGAVPNYQGLSYQQMRNRVSQDVFKNALWGRPIGYFWHVNELRPDEVENFMDALVQGGATLESNTQMMNLAAVVPGERCGAAGLCGWELLRLCVEWDGGGFPADGEFTGEGCGRESGSGVSIRFAGNQSELVWSGVGDRGVRVCAGELQRHALKRESGVEVLH